jgi:tRNA A-37 threonylcarbamoyl transferase component Bud32
VDKQYEQYCVADPLFYDAPDREGGRAGRFEVAARPLPAGWRREPLGNWLVNLPPNAQMSAQGWKIHVSACPDNAGEIIERVWHYCVPREISFKFIPDRLAVLMRNAKYAPRASSGKVITIYPPDESACERILRELDAILGGAPGPYILSDLRFGAGPLYVRYGGFTQRYCLDGRGETVPAIETPGGDLVPDQRAPVFTVPSWVRLPEYLESHLAARNSVTVGALPYEVRDALHFSNGGGVYVAVDKCTGERVILKEARPYAGLAADGSDAVTRLRREHDMLQRLSGLGIAPEVRGFFQIGEHHFLAEEFIEGMSLNSCYSGRYPLIRSNPDPAEIAAYTSWAVGICAAVERAAQAMHERGVIFNDLHMFNIMVRPDDSVALIDFEAAGPAGEARRLTVGNPGFVAPRDRAGFDVDAYSVACLRLAMFMPLTNLFALDRGKAAQLAAVIAGIFPVPAGFLDRAVREITRGAPAGGAAKGDTAGGTTARSEYKFFAAVDQAWPALRAALTTAIAASATTSRWDRLFPGDIEQFRVPAGGLGLAHGAAGVLYALDEAAGVRRPEYEQWLLARVAEPIRGSRLGLYDGLAGVAYVLSRFGHAAAALRTAELCLGDQWERLGSGLHDGLAGFSLAMLAVGDAAGEAGLLDAGLKAAEIVADRVRAPSGGNQDRPAGLMRGAAGQALLMIRLYERTGDPAYLDAAQAAVAADLARCILDGKGSLQVDEGWRAMPYLAGGSVGIGLVIDRFLAHRQTAAFAEAADAIRIAARSTYYAQAGLFSGRAGMIAYLAGLDQPDPLAAEQIGRLAWHAVRYRGGLAFPGDTLLRLSMDLATGTAGVLLAVAAALAPGGAALPFLGPAASLVGRPSPGSAEQR